MTNSKAPELKPCPFCGADAMRHTCLGNRRSKGWYETKHRVSCSGRCHCSSKACDEQREADLDWNTRSDIHDALVKAADEMADASENLAIAVGMGSDLDGVVAVCKNALSAYHKARGETQ